MTATHECGSSGWAIDANRISCKACGCTWEFVDSEWQLDQDTDPDYHAFLAGCARECQCDDCPCVGVTSGGFCDGLSG